MNPGIWIFLGNNATHKKACGKSRHLRAVLRNLEQSGDVILAATTNAAGLIEEGCGCLSALSARPVSGFRRRGTFVKLTQSGADLFA
jgi:hypothetical protein